MRPIARALALAAALIAAAPAYAVLPEERLADPALEERARALSQQIRCQVCQNQSIDDSNAALAADLRRIVRERLSAGDSDGAVLGFLVQRYGDYVLLSPPVRPTTWLLWFGPIAILLVAAGGAYAFLRRRSVATAGPPLSAEEQAKLDALLSPRREG